MIDWFNAIEQSEFVSTLARHADAGGDTPVRGISGSSPTLLAAAVGGRTGRTVLLVVGHLDEADEALDELESLGIDTARFPALELAAGQTFVAPDLLAERLVLVRRLQQNAAPAVIVAPVHALMQTVPTGDRLAHMLREIRIGDEVNLTALTGWLADVGFRRVETIESEGEFAVRGGIIDIFPPHSAPVRIDLFGDEVESIHDIALETMGSDRQLDRVHLVGATVESIQQDHEAVPLPHVLPASSVAWLAEVLEITEQGRSYFDRVRDVRGIIGPPAVFKAIGGRCHAVIENGRLAGDPQHPRFVELLLSPLPDFTEGAAEAVKDLVELAQAHRTIVLCQNDGESSRMRELLREEAPNAAVEVQAHYLHRGLIWDDEQESIALVPYHELMHRFQTRRRIRRIASGGSGGMGGRAIDAFVELQPGDLVVHQEHGIARFAGLRTLEKKNADAVGAVGGAEEYLTLEFAGSAKLHVPASKIELVQKYIGAARSGAELSTLGGKRWKNQKEKVAEAVRDLAGEMLRVQALRETTPGIRFPADTTWQVEFEAEFPYEETEDQLAAIAAVKKDMNARRPMDRLVCGDVGFGKTEIAIRAAFKAAEYGKQVAILVPTTVLAEQHERSFGERFADYPFRIESLSRFKTAKEQKAILADVARGRVDIVIGTHRLLSRDVKFSDLGLVVIDEEQRFGVEHKQRLLEFRATADVLTLSATPIPRTLHMALLGLRDISSLTTPPLDRRSIVTELIPPNPKRIRQALERELAREGQIFYVHNRVQSIDSVADDVRKLVPDARIVVGHGQMPPRELERVMLAFMRGDADILVCTTIIESGIDIPTANTMFISNGQMFGLSELHQLRGRVGRYKHRAYCYVLLPKNQTITEVAMKRLHAFENYSMLGAGFQIALRDLEIRGAGNLLGAEQSGHITAVGYEMYCQLLEQAVADLKNEHKPDVLKTTIDLGITGSIPRGYIQSDVRRMDAYRRISRASTIEQLEHIEQDLISAYGDPPPQAARTLIELSAIRISAATLGIVNITRREQDIVFRTPRIDALREAMAEAKGTLRVVGQPDDGGLTEVYYRPPASYFEGDSILTVLRRRLHPALAAEERKVAGAVGGV